MKKYSEKEYQAEVLNLKSRIEILEKKYVQCPSCGCYVNQVYIAKNTVFCIDCAEPEI